MLDDDLSSEASTSANFLFTLSLPFMGDDDDVPASCEDEVDAFFGEGFEGVLRFWKVKRGPARTDFLGEYLTGED